MTSIRDIAKLAGVSAASVSRILNRDETFSINENTRKRVIEYANQLNYSKEKQKKGARSVSNAQTIALISRHTEENELNDPYFQLIRRGIEKEAAKWRLGVRLVFRMHDAEKDLQQLEQYGAVIVIGTMTEEGLAELYRYNQQIILVDDYKHYARYDSVRTDFDLKTDEMLELLYERKHTKIAFIGGFGSRVNIAGKTIVGAGEVRADSYRKWMTLHGLQDNIDVYQDQWSAESALHLTNQLLQNKVRPTAIVAASDPMAVGIYKALHEANLRIPEDIAVVSFDDISMAAFMTPALSTVHANMAEMGAFAVSLAKGRMLDQRKMPVTVICASNLMIRESI